MVNFGCCSGYVYSKTFEIGKKSISNIPHSFALLGIHFHSKVIQCFLHQRLVKALGGYMFLGSGILDDLRTTTSFELNYYTFDCWSLPSRELIYPIPAGTFPKVGYVSSAFVSHFWRPMVCAWDLFVCGIWLVLTSLAEKGRGGHRIGRWVHLLLGMTEDQKTRKETLSLLVYGRNTQKMPLVSINSMFWMHMFQGSICIVYNVNVAFINTTGFFSVLAKKRGGSIIWSEMFWVSAFGISDTVFSAWFFSYLWLCPLLSGAISAVSGRLWVLWRWISLWFLFVCLWCLFCFPLVPLCWPLVYLFLPLLDFAKSWWLRSLKCNSGTSSLIGCLLVCGGMAFWHTSLTGNLASCFQLLTKSWKGCVWDLLDCKLIGCRAGMNGYLQRKPPGNQATVSFPERWSRDTVKVGEIHTTISSNTCILGSESDEALMGQKRLLIWWNGLTTTHLKPLRVATHLKILQPWWKLVSYLKNSSRGDDSIMWL